MTEPTTEPSGALIEVLEQHPGEKYPTSGPGSLICPNHLRINGVGVFTTEDHPVTIHEIRVNGTPGATFMVTVSLLARALSIGGTPAFPPPEGSDPGGVVVEVPDVDAWQPGDELQRPYALLNGQPLYLHGGIGIGEMVVGAGGTCARVTLTLLCRRLLVDDDPTG